MKIAELSVKWFTIGLFLLSILMFFLPYRGTDKNSWSGFTLVRMSFEVGDLWPAELILRFVVPVCLVVIAALVLIKTHLATSIIATILSVMAFGVYSYYINDYFTDKVYGVAIGLEVNYIISILGMILPIVIIILHIINKKKQKKQQTNNA